MNVYQVFVAILITLSLSTCRSGPLVVPAWYAPIEDHNLECIGGAEGECSMGQWGTVGGL